jgi:hypothetical protein
MPAGLADPNHVPFAAQRTTLRIEKGIRLEDPAFQYAKSGRAQQTASRRRIRQRQLDFNFVARLGAAYNFLPTIA